MDTLSTRQVIRHGMRAPEPGKGTHTALVLPGLQSRTGLRGRNHAESDRHTLCTWGNAVTGLLGTY